VLPERIGASEPHGTLISSCSALALALFVSTPLGLGIDPFAATSVALAPGIRLLTTADALEISAAETCA
jgi:hypothetical protein